MKVRLTRLTGIALTVLLALLLTACAGSGAAARPPATAQVGPGRAECGGTAPADVDAGQTSPVRLLDALGTRRAPVSYVFVIDLSRSMQQGGRYAQVRAQLRMFLGALCPDDQVAAVTFADRADTPVRLSPLSAAPNLVNALPPRASGNNTDVGAGLQRALDEVDAVPAGQRASVVLLTDGDHQAPKGSAYPQSTGPAWDRLHDRAETAAGQRPLTAFALPLLGSSGVSLLASVFPDSQDLTIAGPAPLAEVLGRGQQKVRLAQAAPLLDQEQGTGVAVEWPALDDTALSRGETTVGLALRNTSAVFPATVRDARLVSVDGFGITADPLPPTISLAAGQTVQVPVRVRWTMPEGSGLFPGEGTYESDLALRGSVASFTAEGLGRLTGHAGSPTDPSLQDAGGVLSGRGPVSIDLGLWAALLVLVAVLVLAVLNRFPRLEGRLLFLAENPRDEQRPLLVGTVPLGRRWAVLRPSDSGLELPEYRASVLVHGRRSLLDRRRVTARVRVRLRPRRGTRAGTAVRHGCHDVPLDGRRLVVGLDVRHNSDPAPGRVVPPTLADRT